MPNSIEYLEFGNYYKQKIKNLPSSLIHFKIKTSDYKFPIDEHILPKTLKYLYIHHTYKYIKQLREIQKKRNFIIVC